MIIKVILYLVAYLFIGITFLELELWHDRKVDFIKRWVNDPTDDIEVTMTVLFWPVIFLVMVAYLLCIGFSHLFIGLNHFIKGIRIFFITIVYLIATIIDKERGDKE